MNVKIALKFCQINFSSEKFINHQIKETYPARFSSELEMKMPRQNLTFVINPKKGARNIPQDVEAVVTQINRARMTLGRSPTADEVSRYGSMLERKTAPPYLRKNLLEAERLGVVSCVEENGQIFYDLTLQGQELVAPNRLDNQWEGMGPQQRKRVKGSIAKAIVDTKQEIYRQDRLGARREGYA